MSIKRTVLLVLAVVSARGWFPSLPAVAAATLDITTRDSDITCAKSVPYDFTLVTFSFDHKGCNPLNVGLAGSTIITGTGPDLSANLLGGYLLDRNNRVGTFGRDNQLLFTELEGCCCLGVCNHRMRVMVSEASLLVESTRWFYLVGSETIERNSTSYKQLSNPLLSTYKPLSQLQQVMSPVRAN
jgi:hypothetical protein